MSSDLDWVVLRLGGVLTAQPRWRIDPEMVAFEALLPTDGRIHTVDVRDVAAAFVSAATKSVSREVFLIGGDATHRITQGAITADITAAMGLRGGMPPGRPGDPRNNQSGSPPTGWTPLPHRMSLAFNAIRYRTCLPSCGAPLAGGGGHCIWWPR